MPFLQKIVFAAALFILPLSAQAGEKIIPSHPLRDQLPCKSPDGNYPLVLEERSDKDKWLFALVCKAEGQPWTLLVKHADSEQPKEPEQ